MKRPEFRRPEFRKPDFRMPEFRKPEFRRPEMQRPDWMKIELGLPKRSRKSGGSAPGNGNGGKKRKGIEVPSALADVYYDLRDRRLLPIVALVIVAIAAVPFLLGGEIEEPVLPAPVEASTSEAEGETLVVAAANPGLRDYEERLDGRMPTDPFGANMPNAGGGGGEGGGGGAGGSGGGGAGASSDGGGEGAAEEPPAPPAPSPGGGDSAPSPGPAPAPKPPAGGGSGTGKAKPDDSNLRLFAFRPDIRFGVAGSGNLNTYTRLEAGRLLPKKNPVIVFVGASEDGTSVAFDVSSEVALVRGDGRCIGGNHSCSLLIMKPGDAADLLTGKPNRSFRIKVERIEFVEVTRSKPKPAKASGAGSRASGAAADLGFVHSFSK